MNPVHVPIIRIAAQADDALLAELGAVVFQETFAADNTAENMATYMGQAFTLDRLRQELRDPLATFLIVGTSGRAMGYAKLQRGEPYSCVSGTNPIELSRLYVLAQRIGQGLGAALMKACLHQAKAEGFETVWLGVWERNLRAIHFYQKWGFVPVGSHVFPLGDDPQTDLILQKSLSEEAKPD